MFVLQLFVYALILSTLQIMFCFAAFCLWCKKSLSNTQKHISLVVLQLSSALQHFIYTSFLCSPFSLLSLRQIAFCAAAFYLLPLVILLLQLFVSMKDSHPHAAAFPSILQLMLVPQLFVHSPCFLHKCRLSSLVQNFICAANCHQHSLLSHKVHCLLKVHFL